MKWFRKFWKGIAKPMPKESEVTETPFMNFTPRAQQVLALARKEADRLNHNYVGTEHLLLGLIMLGQGTAVTVLGKMGVVLDTVRLEVEKQAGKGSEPKMFGNIPYTPRTKRVLGFAQKEAKALNHTYVGTEHILLGILREGDGTAARVLTNLDVDLEETRQKILRELDPNFAVNSETSTTKATGPMSLQLEAAAEFIDTTKRYDVYCNERKQEVVVYRNALFKGTKKLFKPVAYGFWSEFHELEQANGQTIFISRSSVLKFCEHGVTPQAENVLAK